MKKNVLGFLAMVLCACSEPVRYEATTERFCRPGEYEDAIPHQTRQRTLLTQMANGGWIYQGAIHNDGINCSVIYFTRAVTR